MDQENPINVNQTPYFKEIREDEGDEVEEVMDVNELFSPSPAKERVPEDFLEPAVRVRMDQLLQNICVFHNNEKIEEIYMSVEF